MVYPLFDVDSTLFLECPDLNVCGCGICSTLKLLDIPPRTKLVEVKYFLTETMQLHQKGGQKKPKYCSF